MASFEFLWSRDLTDLIEYRIVNNLTCTSRVFRDRGTYPGYGGVLLSLGQKLIAIVADVSCSGRHFRGNGPFYNLILPRFSIRLS